MRFTVIAPVHNEEEMLPYTIKSVFDLEPDQVLWGLDRCTDSTERIIRDWGGEVVRFTDSDGCGWCFRPAYLRRTLYGMSQNDVIVNTSADLRLDPVIRLRIKNINNNYGLISFHYYELPWNLQQFERALISRIRPGFAGLLAFSKCAWRETEDLEDLKTIQRSEDTHLQLAIKTRYKTRHYHTRSLHLRHNENKRDHYLRGVSMYQLLHRDPFTAFFHSLVMLRPSVFTGYIHARRLKN